MNDEAYSRLAFDIVTQAVNDYKKAAKRLIKNHSNKKVYDEILELEEFFKSDWCNFLLQDKMTGDYILKNLRKEYENDIYYTEKERVPKPSGKTKTQSRENARKSRRI